MGRQYVEVRYCTQNSVVGAESLCKSGLWIVLVWFGDKHLVEWREVCQEMDKKGFGVGLKTVDSIKVWVLLVGGSTLGCS